MPTTSDPVLLYLFNEFASLRAQMATMTRQETIMLGLSLATPCLLLLYGLFLTIVPEPTPCRPDERLYVSPSDPKDLLPLPPALAPTAGPAPPPEVALSIVVPSYNEKLRLPAMLAEVHTFLAAPGRTRAEAFGAGVPTSVSGWEVIVVDDGSEDGTDLVALSVGHEWEKLGWSAVSTAVGQGEMRVVKLEQNRGKGGAVKHGILHSRGARVLFADADGASAFASLSALQASLDSVEIPYPSSAPDTAPTFSNPSEVRAEATTSAVEPPADGAMRQRARGQVNGGAAGEAEQHRQRGEGKEGKLGVAVGSRAHLVSTDLVVKRSKIRNLLMHSFHLFVRTLGVRAIRDTQCGFKLFTRDAAALLFADLHLERWSFDVELLVLASACTVQATSTSLRSKASPIPVSETPIDWTEIPGSKISLIWDSVGMARDLVVLRLCLGVGKWGVPRIVLEREQKRA